VKAELKIEDREIALTVEDNGCGLTPESRRTGLPTRAGGNGIPGMRRRAESLDGVVEIASLPAGGCQVSIRLPLRRLA
jgi:signal transduction histidine kinase